MGATVKWMILLIVSFGLFSAGFGAAAAIAVDDEAESGPPEEATVTIPGEASVYTGTLTVRELEQFTVTRPGVTTTTPGADVTETETVSRVVRVEVPGPRGPRGLRGPPGPPGMECPAGFAGEIVTVNTPGGQETWFVCVQQ